MLFVNILDTIYFLINPVKHISDKQTTKTKKCFVFFPQYFKLHFIYLKLYYISEVYTITKQIITSKRMLDYHKVHYAMHASTGTVIRNILL